MVSTMELNHSSLCCPVLAKFDKKKIDSGENKLFGRTGSRPKCCGHVFKWKNWILLVYLTFYFYFTPNSNNSIPLNMGRKRFGNLKRKKENPFKGGLLRSVLFNVIHVGPTLSGLVWNCVNNNMLFFPNKMSVRLCWWIAFRPYWAEQVLCCAEVDGNKNKTKQNANMIYEQKAIVNYIILIRYWNGNSDLCIIVEPAYFDIDNGMRAFVYELMR